MVDIDQNDIQRWVEQVWYSERPILWKKSNRGIYLDIAQFNWSCTVSSMSLLDLDSVSQTIISGQSIWKTTSSPAKIYILASWTYMIQWRTFISSALGTWLLSTFIQKNGSWWDVFSAYVYQWITIPLVWVVNFNKWDYINIYFDNETGNDIELSIQITITKMI